MKERQDCKTKETAFTRKRKLGFEEIFLGILDSLKNTTIIELEKLLRKLKKGQMEYTKQAYSKARQNISEKAFIHLNDTIKKEMYQGKIKKYKGYRVLAIDGSTVELPNTKELKEKYGIFDKEKAPYPAGRIHVLYDVKNEIVIDGKMSPYKQSEQENAIKIIKENIRKGEKDILLFDRGYPSVKLIKILNELETKYIFRVSSSFLKEVNEFTKGNKTDETIEIDINARRIATSRISNITKAIKLKLRCVRIELETTEEILITNLTQEEANLKELSELYNSRWKIETNYNVMKNILELENFTGDTEIAIQQDFYATIVLVNLATEVVKEAEIEYRERNKGKEKKYEYKINRRTTIGYLKIDLLEIILEEDTETFNKMWERFIRKISKQVVPIKDNRKFVRPLGHKPKYGRTNKTVL